MNCKNQEKANNSVSFRFAAIKRTELKLDSETFNPTTIMLLESCYQAKKIQQFKDKKNLQTQKTDGLTVLSK